jgi:hypothetical protein
MIRIENDMTCREHIKDRVQTTDKISVYVIRGA